MQRARPNTVEHCPTREIQILSGLGDVAKLGHVLTYTPRPKCYATLRRCEIAAIHSRDLVEDLLGWSLVVHGKGSRERTVPLLADVALKLPY